MTGIDYFTWFVLISIVATLVIGFVVLAGLPGNMATANNHPQAAAINMAGWLGMIFTAGIVWIFAMVWAQNKPAGAVSTDEEVDGLKARVAELEAQLAKSGEAPQ